MSTRTTCPECGEDLDWDVAIYDHDEGCCMIANCPGCGLEFKEIYKMTLLRCEYTKNQKGSSNG